MSLKELANERVEKQRFPPHLQLASEISQLCWGSTLDQILCEVLAGI